MSASPWQLASDTTCDYWHQFQQRRALEGMLAQLPFTNLELRKTEDRVGPQRLNGLLDSNGTKNAEGRTCPSFPRSWCDAVNIKGAAVARAFAACLLDFRRSKRFDELSPQRIKRDHTRGPPVYNELL